MSFLRGAFGPKPYKRPNQFPNFPDMLVDAGARACWGEGDVDGYIQIASFTHTADVLQVLVPVSLLGGKKSYAEADAESQNRIQLLSVAAQSWLRRMVDRGLLPQ